MEGSNVLGTSESVKDKVMFKLFKISNGSKVESFVLWLVRWCLRIFYTSCFAMVIYVCVVGGTILIPGVMGYLIGSMGYSVSNNAEMLLSLLAGLFFTAWVFLFSFLLIRFSWRKYLNGIKKTIPDISEKKVDK